MAGILKSEPGSSFIKVGFGETSISKAYVVDGLTWHAFMHLTDACYLEYPVQGTLIASEK